MRWAPPLLLPALAFVAVLGDAPPAQSTAPGAPVEALVAAQCHLCHRAASLPKAGLTESCEGCHAWIRETSASPTARAQALTLFPLWPRYEENVQSYLQVPDLDAAMARLRPDWARRYLANPHDLRPNLPETMPRLGLSAEELDTLASAFGRASVPARPSPEPARVAGPRLRPRAPHRGHGGGLDPRPQVRGPDGDDAHHGAHRGRGLGRA